MAARTSIVSVAAFVLGACGGSEPPPHAPNPSPATVPAPPSADARSIPDDARAAMKQTLASDGGKTAWLYSQPGDPEVAALVASLRGVFEDAGWKVQAETASGISLKPGVMTLMAEEQYPEYVDTVLKALDASGLGAKSASGYRAYYEDKKRDDPKWPGIPMRAEQDFVIVVGRKPNV